MHVRKSAVAAVFAAVAGVGLSASAATLTFSTSAPALGPDGISNAVGAAFDADNVGGTGVNTGGSPNDGAANDGTTYVAHDRAAQGQTFLTGANASGYTLSSITVRLAGYTNNQNGGNAVNNTYWNLTNAGNFAIRVGAIAGTTFTQLGSTETVTPSAVSTGNPGNGGSVNGPGTYLTFTLDTPLTLASNSVYGFDLSSVSSTNPFFEWLGIRDASTSGGNPYADGTAYTSGASGVANGTATTQAGDRVFYLNLTAVPEPASMGLLAVAAAGLLRRRRRA